MEKFTNRLISETSPYLLQHAHNPVDWYAWGEEAFEKAKQEDKAIHLSIGYSACHWCHVLAHESFEDEATAQLLNKNFVNIKVDREERPDLDAIYMNAVQMITGGGGWPMTVFMTPEGKPFYAGTYFPPVDRYGMPGFSRILMTVADWWLNRRSEIEEASTGIVNELNKYNKVANSEGDLNPSMLDEAADILDRQADPIFGGFGSKPKFPPSMGLTFLLRDYLRTGSESSFNVLTLTLDKMARGGMYDQLGGGFHRYSVDERWLVPHFEKMLYDNALLSRIYLDTYLVTHNEFYKKIVEETLDYVVREMTDSTGGFYSSQDADSEGVEGKFFVWSKDEVINLLGEEDGRLFCRYFDISEGGNFEEQSILNVEEGIEVIAKLMNVSIERVQDVIDKGRSVLFTVREKRIKPGRDEKVLTAWNGLMLRSFAEAARVLDRKDYLEIAVRNAEFLLSAMYRDGRLLRTYGNGKSKLNAYHEDYAFVIDGLLSLFQTTCDRRWLDSAVELTETMIDLFLDTEEGNFYFTSKDHEQLITRNKDIFDNAIPSGNTAAAIALIKLSLITGKEQYGKIAESTLKSMKDAMVRMPSGFGNALCALDMYLYPPTDLLQCPI